MKRLLYFLALAGIGMLAGCANLEEEIQELKTRVATLENAQISTIDDQIAAIERTVKTLTEAQESLEKKDSELLNLIKTLQASADASDEQFSAIQDALKTLTAVHESLAEKDKELATLIDGLRTYIDESLSKEKDWIKATYCTLEQYQAMADEVASLKETIRATYCTLEQLQALADEIASLKENMEDTYATLEQFKNLSEEVAALKSQFNEAGKEYDDKLAALDNAVKAWVGEALSGYYDMAAMDAKLAALATKEEVLENVEAVKKDIADTKEQITEAKEQIAELKEQLTDAYKQAIAEAIETNNGVIDEKIAQEVGKALNRIEIEAAVLRDRINRLELRIDDLDERVENLEDEVAGLRISDMVFGFVLYTQKDTITKGLKFPITFRVNPSGVPFTQDMLVLDNMSTTKYLVVEEDTKASYITESKNFYVDSLGMTRNAANEETEGQYFARLGTRETRNLIDDSIFSLVGAYRDKEDVVQYVSTNPFQLVMMPTPEEGLSPWYYAHGNATRLAQVIVPAVPATDTTPAQDAKSYFKEELGSISFSLDSRTYKQENGDARQTYSTRKYIRTLAFEGDSKEDSIVIFQPLKDSGFVRFIPDTSKAVWAALLDTTKITSLKVKGKIHAVDRFGGSSTFPVEMTWYSRHRDTLDIVKNASEFYEADGVTKKPFIMDLESEFEKHGYYYAQVDAARRKVVENFIVSGNTGGRIRFGHDLNAGEKQIVTALANPIVGKASLPGTYILNLVNTVKAVPYEGDTDKSEEQIMTVITIRLTIKAD